MSRQYIKYPIAFNNETKELVNISDVNSENKKDLICNDCKECFNCILNHTTPHFRHKPGSNCQGNVESYLHWLTKECFRLIKEIELPEIFKSNLDEKIQDNFDTQVSSLIKHNVPQNLIFEFKKNLKKNLSDSGKYRIEKVDIEKGFKTNIEDVRVDIVATINSQELFIEPHYMNPIDLDKRRKLELIEIPTLSIDLMPFIHKFDYKYKVEDLVNYLISKNGKYWTFNRKDKIEKLIKNYLNYVKKEISKNQEHFNNHLSVIKEITEIGIKVESLEKKIRPTEEKIWNLKDKMRKLENELGINNFDD